MSKKKIDLDWFPLYVDKFLDDTIAWNNLEIGIYLRLLLQQWKNGGLENNVYRLARTVGEPEESFIKHWEFIKEKFPVNEDGKLYNEKMESIRKQQVFRVEQRIIDGKNAAERRWGSKRNQNNGLALALPLGDNTQNSSDFKNDASNTQDKIPSDTRYIKKNKKNGLALTNPIDNPMGNPIDNPMGSAMQDNRYNNKYINTVKESKDSLFHLCLNFYLSWFFENQKFKCSLMKKDFAALKNIISYFKKNSENDEMTFLSFKEIFENWNKLNDWQQKNSINLSSIYSNMNVIISQIKSENNTDNKNNYDRSKITPSIGAESKNNEKIVNINYEKDNQ